ncbi:MAG: c-type cytochrome, partial [Pseudomonadota bacterium]
IAWDPVARKEVWRYQHAGPWNGGALATAGNLVFQGSLIGEFAAYRADSGERLWAFDAQTGVAAAPVSYAVDETQHVAVAAGWGTLMGLVAGEPAEALRMRNFSRILAFRLGGTDALPPRPIAEATPMPEPPALEAAGAQVAAGKSVYYDRCFMCHGINVASGGVLPDLRRATAETHAAWDGIVLGGLRRDRGMPSFAGILTPADSAAVRAFVIGEAQKAYERGAAGGGQ